MTTVNKNSAAILDNFSLHTQSLARLAIVSGSVISVGNLKVHMGGSGRVDQMGAGRVQCKRVNGCYQSLHTNRGRCREIGPHCT
jgi:hypothetical protein